MTTTTAQIDASVRTQVSALLDQIERDRDLRVLFACESGSRAWGFASKDSDYDIRFVFVRPLSDYVRLHPPKDAFDQHEQDLLDAAGWDIRKTADLLYRSNAPLLEWIDSPVIYRAEPDFHERLRLLRDRYFDPKKTLHHYLSLAGGVWSKHIQGNPEPVRKKYLYAIRPLACIRYITLHGRQAPTRFDAVLDGIDWPEPAITLVRDLVAQKKAGVELGKQRADETLNGYLEQWLNESETVAHDAAPTNRSPVELDGFVTKTILAHHARCVGEQGGS